MASNFLLILVVLAVAATAVTATSRTNANDKLYTQYMRQKLFESCLGEENVAAYNTRLEAARATCRSLPSRARIDEPSSQANFAPHIDETPSGLQTYFTEDTVRYLSQRMMSKVSNLTCVLTQLGYMDEFDNINYDALVAQANEFTGVDQLVKDDMIKGINDCKAMAICLPLTDIKYFLTPALMRWSNFSKCKMYGDYQACMKKDLRAKKGQFELGGLGDFLSSYSESDQMYGLVWARQVLSEGSDFLW